MAVFYFSAGVVHLVAPRPLSADRAGFCSDAVRSCGGDREVFREIAGSVALLTTRLRQLAGVMLSIYAVCVFPANIKHAVEGIHVPPLSDSWSTFMGCA